MARQWSFLFVWVILCIMVNAEEENAECQSQQCAQEGKQPYKFSGPLSFGPAPSVPSEPTQRLVSWMESMSDRRGVFTAPCPSSVPEADAARFLSKECHREMVTRWSDETRVVKFGKTSHCYERDNITSVEAQKYSLVGLDSSALISFVNETVLAGTFYKGVLHGLARHFWCRYGECCYEFEDDEPENCKPVYLHKVGWFESGRRAGHAWEFLAGGGGVFGRVLPDGRLEGRDLVYVYPDNATLLVGAIDHRNRIVAVRESRLAGVDTDEHGIAVLNVHKPRGAKFAYDKSDETHITRSRESVLLCDPLESQTVFVGESRIAGAGLGLFLKRDVRKEETVAFINGVRHSRLLQSSEYRITNDWEKNGEMLDVPEDYRKPWEYSATLGHFVNHSPRPNADFSMLEHPRFGRIRSVVALVDLEAGTELTADYGYVERLHAVNSVSASLMSFVASLADRNSAEMKTELRDSLLVVREAAKDYKPYFDLFRSVVKNLM